jgi:GT2 family glycosyltransferase
MDLSIIIVNWNNRKYLRDCLASIFENTKVISFEVIVVDNHSWDGSAEMVKDQFPNTRLIANDVNTFFARGNNMGWQIACGDHVAFLNPDTIVHRDVFEKSIRYLRNHADVGAVSCKFRNPDGSFQREYYRRFPRLSTVFFCFTLLGILIDKILLKGKYESIYYYLDKDFNDIERIDQAGATFLVMRRDVIERIGVFDEDFPMFFNDVDLCKRIWRSGLEIHLLNEIAITHYGGKGIKQFGFAAKWYFVLGCYRYFRKHHGIGPARLVIVLLFINLPAVLAVAVVRIISEYVFNAKKYGIWKANKKAFRLILKKVNPTEETKDLMNVWFTSKNIGNHS